MPTSEQNGYLAERVLTASPMDLIRMLYEGGLSSINRAIEMFRANDILERGKAISKAVAIVNELRASLRNVPEAQMASGLADLYGYITTRLQDAHTHKSEAPLKEASRVLRKMYENWLAVMDKLAGDVVDVPIAVDEPPVALSPYEVQMETPRQGRSWEL